jgi:hypothetical protein
VGRHPRTGYVDGWGRTHCMHARLRQLDRVRNISCFEVIHPIVKDGNIHMWYREVLGRGRMYLGW